jgi:hypothetical protein
MHIHHKQYHDNDVLKDTIFLCPSCHSYEHYIIRLGKIADDIKNKIKLLESNYKL